MSHRHPWGPVLRRQLEERTERNLTEIGRAIHTSYSDLPEPRDTGRLLNSLDINRNGRFGLRVSETRAEYGKFLNSGTGLFGPKHRRITPSAAQVLAWTNAAGGRVFAKSTKGSGKHKGWWDRWRDRTVPAVIARVWGRG